MKKQKSNIAGMSFPWNLFITTVLGFVLLITQLVLLPEGTNTNYYILNLVTIIIYLLVVYLTDKYYRKTKAQIKKQENISKEEKETWKAEKELLQKTLAEYERKENEEKKFASYQDKMLKKIFNDKKALKNRHYFLHLLSESFRAGAAILYKETEPSGKFTVEETYAIQEDYQPKPFEAGEGLNGQTIINKRPMVIKDIDQSILPITSGLGETKNVYLYLLPIIIEDKTKYLIEMTTFHEAEIDKMWNEIATQLVEKHIL